MVGLLLTLHRLGLFRLVRKLVILLLQLENHLGLPSNRFFLFLLFGIFLFLVDVSSNMASPFGSVALKPRHVFQICLVLAEHDHLLLVDILFLESLRSRCRCKGGSEVPMFGIEVSN